MSALGLLLGLGSVGVAIFMGFSLLAEATQPGMVAGGDIDDFMLGSLVLFLIPLVLGIFVIAIAIAMTVSRKRKSQE